MWWVIKLKFHSILKGNFGTLRLLSAFNSTFKGKKIKVFDAVDS